MSDHRSKDKRRPQEAASNDGMSETRKKSAGRSGPNDYDEWTMERLHNKAREKNIKGYMDMERKELIHYLKGPVR